MLMHNDYTQHHAIHKASRNRLLTRTARDVKQLLLLSISSWIVNYRLANIERHYMSLFIPVPV